MRPEPSVGNLHRGLAGALQGTLAAAAPGPNRYQLASLTGREANIDGSRQFHACGQRRVKLIGFHTKSGHSGAIRVEYATAR